MTESAVDVVDGESGSWPAWAPRSVWSRVTRAVTSATESRGRPVAAAGTKTLPGVVASRVFEVITAATVVLSRLALKGLDWITRTGRRFACSQGPPRDQPSRRRHGGSPIVPGGMALSSAHRSGARLVCPGSPPGNNLAGFRKPPDSHAADGMRPGYGGFVLRPADHRASLHIAHRAARRTGNRHGQRAAPARRPPRQVCAPSPVAGTWREGRRPSGARIWAPGAGNMPYASLPPARYPDGHASRMAAP